MCGDAFFPGSALLPSYFSRKFNHHHQLGNGHFVRARATRPVALHPSASLLRRTLLAAWQEVPEVPGASFRDHPHCPVGGKRE